MVDKQGSNSKSRRQFFIGNGILLQNLVSVNLTYFYIENKIQKIWSKLSINKSRFMVYNEMEYMRNDISTFQVSIHIYVDRKTSSQFK